MRTTISQRPSRAAARGMMDGLIAPLRFSVALFPEDDGSMTGVIEELDLIENAGTRDACLSALVAAMVEYAQDFAAEPALWAEAPDRRAHVPYVLKILASTDAQLMEAITCRDGRS